VSIRADTDRGSATVFAAAISLVLVMAATAAVLVVAVVLAGHRARSAADLAALAGATAELGGGDACQAARANARTNDAEVTTCQVNGEMSSFVVAVSVTVPTGLRSPLPVAVGVQAHAGNVAG
jgi:secretion/DNA translocation related TadE-like protein